MSPAGSKKASFSSGLEAVICALALRHGMAWAGVQTQQLDASIPVDYRLDNTPAAIELVLSNSFGFGGTNCSLVFGRAG